MCSLYFSHIQTWRRKQRMREASVKKAATFNVCHGLWLSFSTVLCVYVRSIKSFTSMFLVHSSPADADQKSSSSLTLIQADTWQLFILRINHLNKLLILSIKLWHLAYCTLSSKPMLYLNHATLIYMYELIN